MYYIRNPPTVDCIRVGTLFEMGLYLRLNGKWHIGQIKNTHFLKGSLSQKLLIAIFATEMMSEIKKFAQNTGQNILPALAVLSILDVSFLLTLLCLYGKIFIFLNGRVKGHFTKVYSIKFPGILQ